MQQHFWASKHYPFDLFDGNTPVLAVIAADGSGRKPFVVAIDGPAASGKGTIAKRLAAELQLAHLDTGLLYRGVGWAAISSGVDLADEQAVAALAAQLDMSQLQGNKQLRTDEAAMAASKVSALPAVRAALLQAQRQFAVQPPQHHHGEAHAEQCSVNSSGGNTLRQLVAPSIDWLARLRTLLVNLLCQPDTYICWISPNNPA
jgi:hypothetical protein